MTYTIRILSITIESANWLTLARLGHTKLPD